MTNLDVFLPDYTTPLTLQLILLKLTKLARPNEDYFILAIHLSTNDQFEMLLLPFKKNHLS